jgi:putative peptidoglycan lipid II flippase
VQRDDYRATVIVMLGLVAASLTGFLRQIAIAQQLGAGRATDVYLVAFAVPEFVFIALPIVLSSAFIPLFADCRLRCGEAGAWRFGLRVAGALLAVLLVLTALAVLGAPFYVGWLAPGFGPHEHEQAIQATRLMLPAISLMGLATLVGAALQVYRRFARPALATAIHNLTFVATLLAAPLVWPVGRAAWGVTLGAAAALVLQLPLLWRHCPSPAGPVTLAKVTNSPDSKAIPDRRRHVGPKDATQPSQGFPQVRQVARLAGPLAAGYAVHHLILFVDRAMATALGAGSAAALNYAYHLALVVGQLSGLAVSTALFPRLAEQVTDNDKAGARAGLADALRFVWMVGLPATCGMTLLRTPLVRVLFERGAFGPPATAAVGAALVWYGPAVLADALCQPLWRVVYAQRSGWTVLGVNGLQTGVRLLGNLALAPALGYIGLALSAAIGLSVQAGVLAWLVRRRLGTYLMLGWWGDAARVALAAAAAAIVAGLVASQMSAAPAVVTVLAGGALGTLAYLSVLGALNAMRNIYVIRNA